MLVKESLQKLYEIGEASVQPYNFYLEDSEIGFDDWVSYKFQTEDRDKYIIQFIRKNNFWVIQFSLTGKKNFNHEQVVNKGRNFRVMATVVNVIKIFVEWKHPDKMFMVASKSKEEDKRRLHMYMRYLEKNITSDYTFRTETYKSWDFSENNQDQDVIVIEKI